MIVRLRSTASTMQDAALLAARGEPHGTVVVAEEQTGGIGRHGHAWHSERGSGLYLSIVLRLKLAPDAMPALTMALGLAAVHAVRIATGVRCDLRWPNDLLLNERKLAGILVQASDKAFIAGIGVNVNQTGFPEDLRSIATSLRIETGPEHSKDALLDHLVEQSLRYAGLLEQGGKRAIFDEFEAISSYVRGKSVDVEAANRIITGVTAGLDPNGFLLVQTDGGIETIVTGGVRPRL